jgi:hypothetical protein
VSGTVIDQFQMFNVYLGSIRRKEDFFTYFLASCLQYCYRTDRELFRRILTEVFQLEGVEADYTLVIPKDSLDYLDPAGNQKIYFEESQEILREFPLFLDDRNYYLDIAFHLRKTGGAKPLFVGVEGKVFDRSVSAGQLNKYRTALGRMYADTRELRLYLLSTHDGENSLAAREVSESRGCSLILWDHFHRFFNNIENVYFKSAWSDAYCQLDLNRGKDLAVQGREKTGIFELREYLEDEAFVNGLDIFLVDGKAGVVEKKEEWVVKLSHLDQAEADDLVSLIQNLFQRDNNLKGWESQEGRAYAPKLFRAAPEEQESVAVKIFAQRLEEIAQINGVPGYLGDAARSLVRKAVGAQSSDRVHNLLNRFMFRVAEDSPARQFYSGLFYREGSGLAENIKARFTSNAEKEVRKLGLWISLKKRPSGKPAQISLMTLDAHEIRIKKVK